MSPTKRSLNEINADTETSPDTATLRNVKRRTSAPKPFSQNRPGGTERYPGHDSEGNKKALIDVINYRGKNPNTLLSEPEKTAKLNSIGKSPETGKKNITEAMPSGTAICHKIADKSIRDKINEFFSMESHVQPDIEKGTSGSSSSRQMNILESYLEEGIKYITPDHEAHNTPSSGNYNKEVEAKRNTAKKALESFKQASTTSEKSKFAHEVGKSIANSPINLFIGDSRQNSSNQDNFDPNINFSRLTDSNDGIYTPRSMNADAISATHHSSSRNGSSSSIPKLSLSREENSSISVKKSNSAIRDAAMIISENMKLSAKTPLKK